MINLEHLNVFIHVADSLSFTKAARHLNVSQPTISKYIRDLERELGQQLFDRSGSKPRLTDAGKTLLPEARNLIRQSITTQEMMASMNCQVSGELQIACSTTAGKYILPQLLARFLVQHPRVQASIKRCNPELIKSSLLKSETNLGVVSREVCGDGSIECQEFFVDYIILIVPAAHPWTLHQSIEPEQLLKQPFIIRESTAGTRRVMMTELAKHDITLEDLNILIEVGNAEAIVETVAAGYGASFVSKIAATRALRQGEIKEVHVNDIQLRRKLYMVRRKLDISNRAQETFWSFVHDPENEDLYNLAETS